MIPLYPAEIDEFANRPVVLQHQKLINNLKRDIQHDFTETQIEEFLDQKKNEKKSNLVGGNRPGSQNFFMINKFILISIFIKIYF